MIYNNKEVKLNNKNYKRRSADGIPENNSYNEGILSKFMSDGSVPEYVYNSKVIKL